MAKSNKNEKRKAPAKKAAKPSASSRPSKAPKASVKPAAKASSRPARRPSVPPAKPKPPPRGNSAPPSGPPAALAHTMTNQKPVPEASQVRPHPDAKLSRQEIQTLYVKLVDERNRVLSGFDRHVSEALEDGDVLADEIDIAQRSTDQAWLFRFADKERKLLIEIEAALEKMRTGEYGLCEGTDEPIGYTRLELRPWTRYSVGYKELLEREKAQHTR